MTARAVVAASNTFALQRSATTDLQDGERRDGILEFEPASWSLQSPEAKPYDTSLHGISCTSSSACSASGWYGGVGDQWPSAERWNGSEWRSESIQVPTGVTAGSLEGMSCISASECIAVGADESEAGYKGLANRWNGSEWKLQTLASPAEMETYSLDSVSCASSTACSASGIGTSSLTFTQMPLIERWNGSEWKVQTPAVPKEAWAAWLYDISCPTSSFCMASGEWQVKGTYALAALTEVWNGTEWKLVSTPTPSGAKFSQLDGVSCLSSNECVTVGEYEASSHRLTLVEHWNGTEWQIQSSPNPGSGTNQLYAVSCTSEANCMATGSYVNSAGSTVTLAERWNGKEWSVQAPVNPVGGKDDQLAGISCTIWARCMATGGYETSGGMAEAIAEKYG